MKLHLGQRLSPWLFALSLGCMLCLYCSPPATAGFGPVAAGFSLRCVATTDRCDTSQAKACGYESHESDPMANQPAAVLCAAWYDSIFYGRARTMQTACVVILIGVFMLRKINYR